MHAIKSMSSKTILAGALALAAACSGQKAQPVDAALANDLSLASQAQALRLQIRARIEEGAVLSAQIPVGELDDRARGLEPATLAGVLRGIDQRAQHEHLIAHRQQYWRPIPTVIQLAEAYKETRPGDASARAAEKR